MSHASPTRAASPAAQTTAPEPEHHVLRVRGIVQGVGFRPFVYRHARALGLRGAVWNDPEGVVIDVEGPGDGLERLRRRLLEAPPPRASVEDVQTRREPLVGLAPFEIRESAERAVPSTRVAPDLATCDACLAELRDPRDRRFGYPFLNCTDCGPRYSIVRETPYDRSRTTMARFRMCAACEAEYADPSSRRFHAQPNACAECGPRLSFVGPPPGAEAPLEAALAVLRRGEILALRGLSGFHLACDASRDAPVDRLRERKRRAGKPFAVMFPDLASLEGEVHVESAARALLKSARRPIALLAARRGSALARRVAPGLSELGVFLPYTPLHERLLSGFGGPLVMTSGNLSEEPIAASNEEALERLAGIADGFLLHDRDIHTRADDSVVRVCDGQERVVRRARGYAPEAIRLGFELPPLLAVGGDLKNAFCLAGGDVAVLSQHVGDMESLESQQLFEEVRGRLQALLRLEPELVACDRHPGYHSTALARRIGLPVESVQHHHAHVAACLAEHGRSERVIGVAWDGTGWGDDGSVWGGELLLADLASFERVARIRPVALPGGDAAVREPWRMAVSHLLAAGLGAERVACRGRGTVEAMIRDGVHSVPTSSAGRLFDAVACLLGIRATATWEGQAAAELEACSAPEAEPYPFPILEGALLELDPRPLVRSVVAGLEAGTSVAEIGGRFHAALAAGLAVACGRLRESTGLSTVVLGGGCFANRLLLRRTRALLEAAGFEVLSPERVPAGDGGLALGQAAVAGWRRRNVPRYSG